MSETTRRVDHAGDDHPATHPAPGIVATSDPRGVDAALDVLRAGGHAAEAAVAAALVLGVAEPMNASLGGDAVAIVWDKDTGLSAINGTGRAPKAARVDALDGPTMPETGIRAVTVPGAVDAFGKLVDRFGTRSWAEVVAPAHRLAATGVEFTDALRQRFAKASHRLAAGHGTAGWSAPPPGERFVVPGLAESLRCLMEEGPAAMYRGTLAARIAKTSATLGGWLAAEDLAAHESDWVTPLEGSYRGHPVVVPPPNTQGPVLLEALGLLEELPMADLPPDERAHVAIEALKLAFADGAAFIGEAPESWPPGCLEWGYLSERSTRIRDRADPLPTPGKPVQGDTVAVTVVDGDGNVCSLLTSLHAPFGAAVVADETGVLLHNRASAFSPLPDHPHALGPARRPYHTLMPTLVFRADRPWLALGSIGGTAQPQALLQILVALIDLSIEPELAVARPRFAWQEGTTVAVEGDIEAAVRTGLEMRGHTLSPAAGIGAVQLVGVDEHSGRIGASDPRAGGFVGRTDDD